MGFSYAIGQNGREYLSCDFCGKSRLNSTEDKQVTVRKIPCPFGYCQAYATCQECKSINTKSLHIKHDCDIYAKDHANKEEYKQRRLNAGLYLNVCNKGLKDGMIQSLFKNKEGKEITKITTKPEYENERRGWFWFISNKQEA